MAWTKPMLAMSLLLVLSQARATSATPPSYRRSQDSFECSQEPFNLFQENAHYDPPVSTVSLGRMVGAAAVTAQDSLHRADVADDYDSAKRLCAHACDVVKLARSVEAEQVDQADGLIEAIRSYDAGSPTFSLATEEDDHDPCNQPGELAKSMRVHLKQCSNPSLALAELATAKAELVQAQACYLYSKTYYESSDAESGTHGERAALHVQAQAIEAANEALRAAEANLEQHGIPLSDVEADWRLAARAKRQALIDPGPNEKSDSVYHRVQQFTL